MRDPSITAGHSLVGRLAPGRKATSALTDEDRDRAKRLISLDLVRGLDVCLMLFVNEIAGVTGTPAWLKHVSATADGMTITDLVFPAFLFITGMAIPLALGGRLRRGEARWRVWGHLLLRTIALLVIGVFMVNADEASNTALLPPAVWNVLMTIAVVFIWHRTERDGDLLFPHSLRAHPVPTAGKGRTATGWILGAVGIALLVLLAFVYRADDMTGAFQLRPRWWGILGLIGWAYFVASAVYLLVGNNRFLLLGATVLLYCLCLADQAGQVSWLIAARPFVSVGSMLGSHAAITLSGALLTVMLVQHRKAPEGEEEPSLAGFIIPALTFAAGLAVAGVLLHSLHAVHPAFGINKIRATVTWCLLCSAYTAAAWVAVFTIADVMGWRRWPRILSIAGENALVAYLLAPFLSSLFALTAYLFHGWNFYEALGSFTAIGFVRSAVFAWLVVALCGWIRARGIRLQL
jgi:heparan-alpha-glucosaminide N-acetyltransferase